VSVAEPLVEAALLEVEGVSAGYASFRALFDVSFSVRPRTALAVLGPNGSGKTTIARVCSGLVRPSAGRVHFGGVDVTRMPAWRLARLGVSHAPEGRSVFASLTVEENLVLSFRAALGRAGVAPALERAFARFPRLGERRRQSAATLSGGEQRMLALARVFAAPPKLLVVDELSLGLAPSVVDEVFAALGEVRAAGTTLLVVEQHVDRALGLADDLVVLSKGTVAFRGPKADLGDVLERLLPGVPT
jgi:branched-chain amino acid transport system ATP-binding protein